MPVDDIEDAECLIRFAQEEDGLAETIAYRGTSFITDHLTMGNVTHYWFSLLRQYSSLLAWLPERDPRFILV